MFYSSQTNSNIWNNYCSIKSLKYFKKILVLLENVKIVD